MIVQNSIKIGIKLQGSRFRLGMLCCVLMLTACGNLSPGATQYAYDPALIDGRLAFGESVPPAPSEDILSVSPSMVEFVDAATASSRSTIGRVRSILAAMEEQGFFQERYVAHATYTADKTFTQRSGNCVAYTNLFIALARQSGLSAHYQLVNRQPSWDVSSGYLLRNNHINVLVDGVIANGNQLADISVDFNQVDGEVDSQTKIISDEFAASLYYANIGMDYLRQNDIVSAFAYIKRAILTEPSNHDLWNNLAVLYSVLDKNHQSQRAYKVAAQINPTNKTALAGIAKTLEKQGRFDEAQVYFKKIKRYQTRNPFYHYAVAQQAVADEKFDTALGAINMAIKLQRNPKFFAFRAALGEQVGDQNLVTSSNRMYKKYGGKKSITRQNQELNLSAPRW